MKSLRIVIAFIAMFFITQNLFAQNAAFIGSPLSGCSPLTVNFTDQSTGATSWSWNFGNTNTSTLQNPSATYATPGTYTVTLSINSGADVEVKTNYITVFASPTASFTISNDTVCAGNSVTFNSTSVQGSGTIVKYRWSFGDGNIDTTSGANVNHSYTFSGTFTVNLIITDANGCTSTSNGSVFVNPGPVASFNMSPGSGCNAPLTVTFTNTSTGGNNTYLWTFGDGNTSSSSAVTVTNTYSNTGSFTVILQASAPGCSDTAQQVLVIQPTVAAFNVDTTICVGDTAFFTNATVPNSINNSWLFGDPGSGSANTSALSNPFHRYVTAGTYTVRLITIVNNCPDTAFVNIHVFPNPVPVFSTDTTAGCNLPFLVDFIDATPGNIVAWSWNFGDTGTDTVQNPIHPYNTSGTFNVSLTVTDSNGCSGTSTLNQYIVISAPIANFTETPDSGCIPLNVTFNSTSISVDPIATYYWIFGDGTIDSTSGAQASHIYNTPGRYDVTLVVVTSTGCRDSLFKFQQIAAGNIPTPDFTWDMDTICYIGSVQFTDLSIPFSPTDTITSWLWDFGDGGTSTAQNPNHHFADTGVFTITLTVRSYGCENTIVKQDIITVLPPRADFTITQNCVNYYSVDFTNTSAGADSIVWNFNDGTFITNNSNNVTHVFLNRGVTTVTLYAWNFATGCIDSIQKNFIIAEPIAQFTYVPASGCYPLSVTFTSVSQDAIQYTWTFGDGSPNVFNIPSVSHTYLNPGFYTPILTVTDINGCTDTETKTDSIQAVGPRPGFVANDLTGCAPFIVLFTDTSLTQGGLIVNHSWNFGDGLTAVTTNDTITHVYQSPGTYTVTMTVTDVNGCAKTKTQTAYINVTFPYPALTVPATACPGQSITYNASATTGTGLSYDWDFGDQTTATTNVPTTTHSYANNGTYTVTLNVTDINGCDSTITRTIIVEKPTAAFSVTTNINCINNLVVVSAQFTDLTAGNIPITSWLWNFGNGGAITQNPVNDYTIPGIYDVSLIVTNAAGCSDTLVQDSLVSVPGPTGEFFFGPTSGCAPLVVNFDGSILTGSALYYQWDFGDGTVLSQTQDTILSHTYYSDGTFTPQFLLGFTLPNGNQCFIPSNNLTGSVTVQSVILVNAVPNLIEVTDLDYDTVAVQVTDLSIGGGPPYTYTWNPGQFVATISDSIYALTSDGSLGDTSFYTVSVANSQGCAGIDTVYIIYYECESRLIIPNVFTPGNDGKNDTYHLDGLCPGDFYFRIYNRWGKIIYESNDPVFQWDGKTNDGKIASDGTYYYVCQTGKNNYHGFIKLIREE